MSNFPRTTTPTILPHRPSDRARIPSGTDNGRHPGTHATREAGVGVGVGTSDWIDIAFPSAKKSHFFRGLRVLYDIFPNTIETGVRLLKDGNIHHEVHRGAFVFKREDDAEFFRNLAKSSRVLYETTKPQIVDISSSTIDKAQTHHLTPKERMTPKFHGYKINIKPSRDGNTTIKFPTNYRALGVFEQDASNEITLRLRSASPEEASTAILLAHEVAQSNRLPAELNFNHWAQGSDRSQALQQSLEGKTIEPANGLYRIQS